MVLLPSLRGLCVDLMESTYDYVLLSLIPGHIISPCRLVQDRELQLTDGTRLMEERKYQAAMEAAGLTAQQMEERYCISCCR